MKWSESQSCSVVSNSLCPQVLYSPWNSPGQNTGVGIAFPFSRASSQPGIKPKFPALQADSLPAEPQGKPKNNGVGSLSCLLGIYLTQELNWGLLHCKWILYQLSYQGAEWGEPWLFSLGQGEIECEIFDGEAVKTRTGEFLYVF